MKKTENRNKQFLLTVFLIGILSLTNGSILKAQSFDFEKLYAKAEKFSVVLEIKFEVSFGTHSNEAEQRQLGSIVTEDGLILFDGGFLSQGNAFASLTGVQVKTTPTRIKVTMFDDKTYEADYIGIDRFTHFAFARINNSTEPFEHVKFVANPQFKVGSWVALYMLLPEFVHPPLAADVGMVANLVETPEKIPLTVGFSLLELASVVFNKDLQPVGILGLLMNPAAAQTDASGLLEGFDNFEVPLMGVVFGEKLEEMIDDPPQKGKIDRAWLGISLQALTPDIADFLGIDVSGGIIVNDVVSGSPASSSGLMVGDIIYGINGKPVDVDREERLPVFQRSISEMGPGSSVEFSVFRPGENSTDSLTILTVLERAPMAASDALEYEDERLELKVRDLVFSDYQRLNQEKSEFEGVAVAEMKPGGLAILGGLRIGDIIQRIGSETVNSVERAREILEQLDESNPKEVVFFVWRDNRTLFVNVKAR